MAGAGEVQWKKWAAGLMWKIDMVRLIEQRDQQWREAIRKQGYPDLTVECIERHLVNTVETGRGDG